VSGRGRPSLDKRLREQARQQRQREKEQRRAERRREREARPDGGGADGADPDLAGIVPGPQPQPWMDDSET
jgi:hypothetical protein